jgi:hypothetical protein
MGGVTALLVSTLALSSPAHAVVLFDNTSTANFNGLNQSIGAEGTNNFQRAIGFNIPSGSNNYTLNDIQLRLTQYNTSEPINPDFATLTIFADPLKTSNNPNGLTTALSSNGFIYPNSNSNNVGDFSFTPLDSFTFLANTRYWLLIDAEAGVFQALYSDFTNTPTGIATNLSSVSSSNNGITYASNGTNGFFNTLQVNATPVPAPVPFEFNPTLGLGAIGGFWLVRKGLKKKSTKV